MPILRMEPRLREGARQRAFERLGTWRPKTVFRLEYAANPPKGYAGLARARHRPA